MNKNVSDARLRILQRRRAALSAEWIQIQNDVAHWNRTHPNEKPIVVEPITSAEIEALMSQSVCSFRVGQKVLVDATVDAVSPRGGRITLHLGLSDHMPLEVDVAIVHAAQQSDDDEGLSNCPTCGAPGDPFQHVDLDECPPR